VTSCDTVQAPTALTWTRLPSRASGCQSMPSRGSVGRTGRTPARMLSRHRIVKDQRIRPSGVYDIADQTRAQFPGFPGSGNSWSRRHAGACDSLRATTRFYPRLAALPIARRCHGRSPRYEKVASPLSCTPIDPDLAVNPHGAIDTFCRWLCLGVFEFQTAVSYPTGQESHCDRAEL
jgi:hypothetical protein